MGKIFVSAITFLTPEGYSKGDVGRKDTELEEGYPFYNLVIAEDCFGHFLFYFFSQLHVVCIVVASS